MHLGMLYIQTAEQVAAPQHEAAKERSYSDQYAPNMQESDSPYSSHAWDRQERQ
jgi:hypothetical protein